MSKIVRAAAICMTALVIGIQVTPATAIPSDGAGPDTPGTSASVGPKQVRAGELLSFSAAGFPAGETIYIKIDDGLNCDASAVHGACVYHQQKISANGTVSGSFRLPANLKPGKHWLRMLASEEMRQNGQYKGVKGYTRRGGTDFTVVSGGGSSGQGGAGATGRTPQHGLAGAAAPGAAGQPGAEPNSAEPQKPVVVEEAPSDADDDAKKAEEATSAETQSDNTAAEQPASQQVTASAEESSFPIVGVVALAVSVIVAAFAFGFVARRKRG